MMASGMRKLQNALPSGPRGRGAARCAALLAGLALAACTTSYDLTLMPADSGTLSHGTAQAAGRGQASVTIVLGDKTYNGTWVAVAPDRSAAYVGAGRWRRGYYDGGLVVDRSSGDSVAKALLQAADGSGLRCDFFGLDGGQGTGRCVDDKGLVYDVQIRTRNST
jgi:hypothetical protein